MFNLFKKAFSNKEKLIDTVDLIKEKYSIEHGIAEKNRMFFDFHTGRKILFILFKDGFYGYFLINKDFYKEDFDYKELGCVFCGKTENLKTIYKDCVYFYHDDCLEKSFCDIKSEKHQTAITIYKTKMLNEKNRLEKIEREKEEIKKFFGICDKITITDLL
jgi:hypothetical protein